MGQLGHASAPCLTFRVVSGLVCTEPTYSSPKMRPGSLFSASSSALVVSRLAHESPSVRTDVTFSQHVLTSRLQRRVLAASGSARGELATWCDVWGRLWEDEVPGAPGGAAGAWAGAPRRAPDGVRGGLGGIRTLQGRGSPVPGPPSCSSPRSRASLRKQ